MKWKLVILAFAILLMGTFAVKCARDVGFREGYAPVQPINFSHKIHAGDNAISCQYCHFAADKGRHAGIPPTELCLNCHKKIKPDAPDIKKIKAAIESKTNIKWIRVHNLPDFAYFNHSQHVRVGKVNCQSCHGPVETMTRLTQVKPMNMGWCIDCHRGNEIAPPKDHKNATGGDCARCHY
jgi:hypothetical protein